VCSGTAESRFSSECGVEVRSRSVADGEKNFGLACSDEKSHECCKEWRGELLQI